MEIPSMDRRELFFRDIERGDIVIGRISSIREFGFFMVLICLGSGIMRDISHLEITVSYSLFISLIASAFDGHLNARIMSASSCTYAYLLTLSRINKYKLEKNKVPFLTKKIISSDRISFWGFL